jgi:iron complex outermembrane recepter protein
VAALPGSAAVDVDTIPINLIQRVEVLTGGASAVYGADGVSGVVNFVTRTDFEGIEFRAQTGQSSKRDAESHLLTLTAGTSLADGRGNVAAAVEYNRDERLKATDRRFAGGGGRQLFVTNPGEGFDRIPLGDIRFFDSSRAGAVYSNIDDVFDSDFGLPPDFNGDDTPYDFGTIPFIEPFYQQGGDGTPVDNFIGDLLPRQEKVTANVFFTYEFNERANLFSELKYSRNDALTFYQPSFDFFLWIEDDYAFMPPNIAAAAAGGPVLVSRDHFDLGVRGEDIERETLRGVLGLNGELTDGIDYEVSYVYGQTEVENRARNNRLNDRFAAALDAVTDDNGNPVCRSNLDPAAEPFNIEWNEGIWNEFEPLPGTWAGSFMPGPGSGCVPVNIFGDGAVSEAARNWIMATTRDQSKLTQHVLQAYLSGSSERWFSLPAGGVGFALGAEYREEKSNDVPSAEDRAGLTFGNIIEPTKGDFDVKEVFAEIDVPLLADLPYVQSLSVDAAIRLSDYSTIGNATTWKLGAVWQPIDDITLRATTAEATRAPNIGELFSPSAQTFAFVSDPCSQANLPNGTEFRAGNCAAILGALGVADPGSFIDPNSASIAGSVIGNPDLTEEVADTTTIGVILRPRFIDNLTVTVDWYDIKLDDAVRTATPLEAASLCVDLPSTDNEFCDLFVRQQGTGAIVDFNQQPVNVAQFATRGVDFTASYLFVPAEWGVTRDLGQFNARLIGNKLTKLTFVNLPGADPDSDKGEENAPEWQLAFDLTWMRGPVVANYGLTYFDETQRFTKLTRTNNPNIAEPRYLDYKRHLVHNLHAGYDFRDNISVFGGVNNLTNEKPDIGETFYPVSAVGRYFYFGVQASL